MVASAVRGQQTLCLLCKRHVRRAHSCVTGSPCKDPPAATSSVRHDMDVSRYVQYVHNMHGFVMSKSVAERALSWACNAGRYELNTHLPGPDTNAQPTQHTTKARCARIRGLQAKAPGFPTQKQPQHTHSRVSWRTKHS